MTTETVTPEMRQRMRTWALHQVREDRTDPESIGYVMIALLDALDQSEQRVERYKQCLVGVRGLAWYCVGGVLPTRYRAVALELIAEKTSEALDATDAGDGE